MGYQLDKFRSRLKNARPESTEFKMTVKEARQLLEEFEKELADNIKIAENPVRNSIKTNILDGGTF